MAASGRVRAATRLGWTRNRGAYRPLGAVRPDGGIVPRTLVVIQRRLQVKPVAGCFGPERLVAIRPCLLIVTQRRVRILSSFSDLRAC